MRTSMIVAALVLAFGNACSGCREPDLAPLRADLASSAEIVCAPPAARPPHEAKTRDVEPAELEAAIAKLCEQEAAHAPAEPESLAILHEALVQDRAIVGQVRRSRMMIDAARAELSTMRSPDGQRRTAEEILAKSTSVRCAASWAGLDRFLLATATAQSAAGHPAEALERCADVVALARDEDLTGDMTDLLLANSQLQRAVTSCTPIVDAAPKDAAAKLAASLTVLRRTFPTTLDDVIRRDHAEMMLFAFGKARDPARPFACERANALAAANDNAALTRGDRIDLERAWKAARKETTTPDATYHEAYTLTLHLLDRLIEHAKSR